MKRFISLLVITCVVALFTAADAVDKCMVAMNKYNKVEAQLRAKVANIESKRNLALAKNQARIDKFVAKKDILSQQLVSIDISIQRTQERISALEAKLATLDPNTQADLIAQTQADIAAQQEKLTALEQKRTQIQNKITIAERDITYYSTVIIEVINAEADSKRQAIEDSYAAKLAYLRSQAQTACAGAGQ